MKSRVPFSVDGVRATLPARCLPLRIRLAVLVAAVCSWGAGVSLAGTATFTLIASGDDTFSNTGFFTLNYVSGPAGLFITEVELDSRATGDSDAQFDPTQPGVSGRPPVFVSGIGLSSGDVVMRTWAYGEGDEIVWDVVSPIFLLAFNAGACAPGDGMVFDVDTDRVGPDSSHAPGLPDLDGADLFGDTNPVGIRVRFSSGQEATGVFSDDGLANNFSQATILLPSAVVPEAAHMGLIGLIGMLLYIARRR